MASLQSRIVYFFISIIFYYTKRRTFDQDVDDIVRHATTLNSPETVPKSLSTDSSLSIQREVLEGEQPWEIYHLAGRGHAARKVVVYWHGGGFTQGTYPQHWSLVHRLVKQLDCRVVFPMYTLSPFSTAAAWDRVASDLIVQIAQDPRYRSMEIVFMGDSAGGWMVLRLLNLLCELGLEGDEKKVAHVVRTLERITTAILISPVLSFQIDEATEQAAKGDYWVGLNRLHVYMPLWAYGPTAVPAIAARVPSAAKSKNSWPDVQLPLSHPCYSPINGIEVLERYKLAYPEQPTFRIVSFIGTGDMLWPTTVSLHERLLKLGPDIVTSDITLEEGLYHCYPLVGFTPESKRAWTRMTEILAM